MISSFIKAIYHILRYHNLVKVNLDINENINFGSDEANNFFESKLSNCKVYLEYGSGSSTLLADKKNKNYFSIESDKSFYKKLKNRLKRKYILKELGYVYFSSIPMLFTLRKSFLIKKAKKYVNDILEHFNKNKIVPDFILIDGRYRVLCALQLHNFFKDKEKSFTIIVDDYTLKPDYLILEKFFEIKKIGRFGVLEKSKDQNPNKLIETYSIKYM